MTILIIFILILFLLWILDGFLQDVGDNMKIVITVNEFECGTPTPVKKIGR